MPRKYVKVDVQPHDWKDSFYEMIKSEVKHIDKPMSDKAWKKTLSRYFEIDMELASEFFMQLIEDQLLLFVKRNNGHNIYINTFSPLENQLS